MTATKTHLAATIAAVFAAFTIGWTTRDIIRAEQIVIVNQHGERAATLAADQLGNGVLLLFDAQGNETASIRNGILTIAESRTMPASTSHSAPAAGGSSAAAPPTEAARQFVLRILSHRTLEPDAALLRQIASLKKEIAAHRDKIASINRWLASPFNGGDDIEKKRAREARRKEVREHEKLIKEKETQIAQLQRQYDTPIQEIIGTDADGNEIWLTTTRDLSRILLPLNRGDFIHWVGTFQSHSESHRIYTVDNIKPIDRPGWF